MTRRVSCRYCGLDDGHTKHCELCGRAVVSRVCTVCWPDPVSRVPVAPATTPCVDPVSSELQLPSSTDSVVHRYAKCVELYSQGFVTQEEFLALVQAPDSEGMVPCADADAANDSWDDEPLF